MRIGNPESRHGAGSFRHQNGRGLTKMTMKQILLTAVIALAAVAVANRVQFVKNIVAPAA